MAKLLIASLLMGFTSVSLLCFTVPNTALAQDGEEEPDNSIVFDAGVDTTLAQVGRNGPEQPHGTSHPEGNVWEFDLENRGGQLQGLIWFDIPQAELDSYNGGTAMLQLQKVNPGHAANLHLVTADWLGLGDSVTWNNMPGGPGIVAGVNAAAESNAQFPEFGSGNEVVEVDVSQDVLFWSLGVPNYGWAFLPTGTNGATITSFESTSESAPKLVLTPGAGPELQAGDADRDYDFDQLDLVKVLIAGKYLTGQPATWGDGDWDASPGGSQAEPPVGDGLFDQRDIISAALADTFLQGSYKPEPPPLVINPPLQAGDADADLDFDQFDLVKVQIAGKYLTGQSATWGDGDWNGAPGGTQVAPPPGDNLFNQLDIISAAGADIFLTGPYAAIEASGVQNDAQTSIRYDAATGEVSVDAPLGRELTSINIDSAAGVFTGDPAQNLGGSFDNDADNNVFKATFGASFGSLSFGNVAPAGLSEAFLVDDLSIVGSLAGGGDLGDVDLIYVPEPSSGLLLTMALLSMAGCLGRHRRRDRISQCRE